MIYNIIRAGIGADDVTSRQFAQHVLQDTVVAIVVDLDFAVQPAHYTKLLRVSIVVRRLHR